VVNPILVVDDDPDMRRMMVDLLGARGIRAFPSESAEEALEALRRGAYALVVSDIELPAKDGFELLREIRALECDAPVVLMTSFGGPEMERRATLVGALGYLEKPFQPEELYELVDRVLEE
jgi:DNA-binding NtrC family response regulator